MATRRRGQGRRGAKRMTISEIAEQIRLPSEYAGLPPSVRREVLEEIVAEILAEDGPQSPGRTGDYRLEDIAKEVAREEGADRHLSDERIRQIEAKGLAKCARYFRRHQKTFEDLNAERDLPRYSRVIERGSR